MPHTKAIAKWLSLSLGWNISVSMENPANSLLKDQLDTITMQIFPDGHDIFLDHWMHDGARDKASLIWSYTPWRPTKNMLNRLL